MRYVLMPFQFAGTAFAFALFGIGGVIFGLLITPVRSSGGGSVASSPSSRRSGSCGWRSETLRRS